MVIDRIIKYDRDDIIIDIELINNVGEVIKVRWKIGLVERLVSEVYSFNTPSRSFQVDGMSDIRNIYTSHIFIVVNRVTFGEIVTKV